MVIAAPFPSPQGSQVLVGQMCTHLAERGHEVHLLSYGQGSGRSDGGYHHHRIRRLPGDDSMRSGPSPVKPVLDVLMASRLTRLLGSSRFDLVHCHNYEATVLGIAVRMYCGVPVVYHSHNLMGDELATYFDTRLAKWCAGRAGRFLDATVPRRADHAIALCEASAGELRRLGVAEGRLSVIPPGLDDGGAAAASAVSLRPEFGLAAMDEQGLLIGYCGNLDAYQNMGLLLDGLSCAAATLGPRRVALLVATHTHDSGFAAAVKKRGLSGLVRCVVVEDFSQARRAMEAADVLVLPRRRGSGYPIKLLNYMSLGRPIVTAGCGAKALRTGVEALCVGDDDGPGLGRALCALAEDRGRGTSLGRAARRRFLAELSWPVVVPAIEKVYAQVFASRGEVPSAHAV